MQELAARPMIRMGFGAIGTIGWSFGEPIAVGIASCLKVHRRGLTGLGMLLNVQHEFMCSIDYRLRSGNGREAFVPGKQIFTKTLLKGHLEKQVHLSFLSLQGFRSVGERGEVSCEHR